MSLGARRCRSEVEGVDGYLVLGMGLVAVGCAARVGAGIAGGEGLDGVVAALSALGALSGGWAALGVAHTLRDACRSRWIHR